MKDYIIEQHHSGKLIEPVGIFRNKTIHDIEDYLRLKIDVFGVFKKHKDYWTFTHSQNGYYWMVSEYEED